MLLYSLAIGLVGSLVAAESMPYIRPSDLQGVAHPEKAQWLPVSKDMQFLPVDELPKIKQPSKRARLLEEEDQNDDGGGAGSWEEYNPYSVQPFVAGMGDYDEYQQAWRLLGFMIDCNYVSSEQQDEHGGSRDGETTQDGCARYLLWAAYVDLDYQGGEIAEYQYWNATKKSWDNSACRYAKGNDGSGSRCAKMDCHSDDTHFQLLGFFKHRSYDDWMEQLFKHEGMCVWSDEEYEFMKDARKAWPRGCTDSGATTQDGNPLYYDIKPMAGGRIAVGLYLDTKCIVDYSSDTTVVEEILGNFFVNRRNSHDNGDQNNNDYSGESLATSMAKWNSAFDVWHICHPCVAHDLQNTQGTKYTDYGGDGDIFECYDDAGYTNVNQCMKFSAKTTMETATFRDIGMSRAQNSLTANPLAGYMHSDGYYFQMRFSNFLTYAFLSFAVLALCFSCSYLYKASTETGYDLQGAVRDNLLVDKAVSA